MLLEFLLVGFNEDKIQMAKRNRVRLHLEALEDRKLMYATMTGLSAGSVFAHPERITYSVMPDSTSISGFATSNLYSVMTGNPGLESQIDTAFAIWGSNIGVNFVRVADDGAVAGGDLITQGSTGHGDIRIGGYNMGTGFGPGYAWNPPQLYSNSLSSDIFLNMQAPYGGGSGYDVTTVMLHEIGHAIGMEHSIVSGAIMEATVPIGTSKTLNSDDVTGARTLFPITYDGWGATSYLSPGVLTVGAGNKTNYTVNAKVYNGYTEWFYIAGNGNGTNMTADLTITINSIGISQLTPVLTIKNSSGVTIDTKQSASINGDSLSITIPNAADTAYYITVAGRSGYVSAGAYEIVAAWGQSRPLVQYLNYTPAAGTVPFWGTGTGNPDAYKTLTWSIPADGTSVGAGLTSNIWSNISNYTNWSSRVDYTSRGITNITEAIEWSFDWWTQYTGINFVQVADTGAAYGATGYTQGAPTAGDIRFYGLQLSGGTLGTTNGPPSYSLGAPFYGNKSIAGDIFLNSDYVLAPWSSYNILQVITHEIGHSLGLDHTGTVSSDLMYANTSNYNFGMPSFQSTFLSTYYPKYDDAYGSGNNQFYTAAVISTPTNYTQVNDLVGKSSASDWFWVQAPATVTSSRMTVTAQTSNLSHLATNLYVYDSSLNLLGSSLPTTGGKDGTVTIYGVQPSSGYFIQIVGNSTNAYWGKYALAIDFGRQAASTYTVGSGSISSPGYRLLEGDGDTSIVDAVNAELIALSLSLSIDDLFNKDSVDAYVEEGDLVLDPIELALIG